MKLKNKISMKKITILGSGAWGVTLANTVAENNNNICVWSNDQESIDEINENHTNSKYIIGAINEKIYATTDLQEAVLNANLILFVLPSNVIKIVVSQLKNITINFEKRFLICTKGFDGEENKFLSDVIQETFVNSEIAVLCGPNFAEEIFNKVPSITTIATKNLQYFNEIKNILSCEYLNLEYFEDMKAVQLCGLVKNVTAILCGIAEGLLLGRNTFAGIITKGLKEIEKLCHVFNCNEKVISTSAGVGDLVLTCTSLKSRNMNFGYKIGSGENIQEILQSIHSTVEGLLNAQSLAILDKEYNIKNSLSELLLEIIDNNYSREELKSILIKQLL